MDFELSTLQWSLAIVAALAVGVSKAGFGGIGLIAVSIMVDLFGKPSVGILLPMLILADLTVYPLYRQHASWRPVWQLLPPTLLGCGAGFLFLDWLPNDDDSARSVIGGIILNKVALPLFSRF
jgi:uncharacterized membrane protein YfcA